MRVSRKKRWVGGGRSGRASISLLSRPRPRPRPPHVCLRRHAPPAPFPTPMPAWHRQQETESYPLLDMFRPPHSTIYDADPRILHPCSPKRERDIPRYVGRDRKRRYRGNQEIQGKKNKPEAEGVRLLEKKTIITSIRSAGGEKQANDALDAVKHSDVHPLPDQVAMMFRPSVPAQALWCVLAPRTIDGSLVCPPACLSVCCRPMARSPSQISRNTHITL